VGGSLGNLWASLLFRTLGGAAPLVEHMESAVVYILIQEIFSWIIVIRLITMSNNVWNLALFAKLGLPPIHSWFIFLIERLPSASGWLLSIRKRPTLIFTVLTLRQQGLVLFIVSSVISLGGLIKRASIVSILFFRRVINTTWGVLVSYRSSLIGCIFLLVYLVTIYRIIPETQDWRNLQDLEFLSIGGLPPSHIFLIKVVSILYTLVQSDIVGWLLMRSSVVMILAYTKIWETGIVKEKNAEWGSLRFVFLILGSIFLTRI